MLNAISNVTFEKQGHVLLIGLNRPEKLNAADMVMLQESVLAYEKLESNPEP